METSAALDPAIVPWARHELARLDAIPAGDPRHEVATELAAWWRQRLGHDEEPRT
jgi:hypothetical protein